MTSVFALSLAAMLFMAGEPPRQGNFEIQNLMSSYNQHVQALDTSMMELKRLQAQPSTSDDATKQQKQRIDDLRKAVGAISDIAKKAQLAAKEDQAARRRVVEGYAAEFYSGSQALQRMATAFQLHTGPRGVEELQRMAEASSKLKKAAEDLRRATAPPKQQRER